MPPLLAGIFQYLGQEGPAVVLLVIDAQVLHLDGRIHGEGRRKPPLVGRQDMDLMPVGGPPIGLVREYPFHPGRTVGASYAVDEDHVVLGLIKRELRDLTIHARMNTEIYTKIINSPIDWIPMRYRKKSIEIPWHR